MKIKLFCFPYAGASANFYLKWKPQLDANILLVPVEYPGRGKRFNAPLCDSLTGLIDDLYAYVSTECQEGHFAFFGHSLGCLAAFELTYRLQQENRNLPLHLFFSGHNAPHYEKDNKVLYNLPEAEFIKEIISLGGTTPEVFKLAEMKELFLPILRADLKIADTYKSDKRHKLDINMHILYGVKDLLISSAGISAWKECTSRECRITTFEGDHMYLVEKDKEIIRIINQVLCAI